MASTMQASTQHAPARSFSGERLALRYAGIAAVSTEAYMMGYARAAEKYLVSVQLRLLSAANRRAFP
eukprot:1376228-Amorphochlora_amoeboformis.AAC.2